MQEGQGGTPIADLDALDEILAEFGGQADVARDKMFGRHCLTAGGKVIAVLSEGDLVFKLTEEAHAEALRLEGAHLWDPRGKGYPMREWISVPAAHSSTWGAFAREAYEYVTRLAGK